MENTRWRRLFADGAEWEARMIAGPRQTDPGLKGDEEILEFVCTDGTRRSRRVTVAAGSLPAMDDAALHRAYRRALPIAGDHYGRPGKPTTDAPHGSP